MPRAKCHDPALKGAGPGPRTRPLIRGGPESPPQASGLSAYAHRRWRPAPQCTALRARSGTCTAPHVCGTCRLGHSSPFRCGTARAAAHCAILRCSGHHDHHSAVQPRSGWKQRFGEGAYPRGGVHSCQQQVELPRAVGTRLQGCQGDHPWIQAWWARTRGHHAHAYAAAAAEPQGGCRLPRHPGNSALAARAPACAHRVHIAHAVRPRSRSRTPRVTLTLTLRNSLHSTRAASKNAHSGPGAA